MGLFDGLLDDENLGLLGGVAAGIKGGIQGYQDASDRNYKRAKMDADFEDKKQRRLQLAGTLKAKETELERKRDADDLDAYKTSGVRVQRDPLTKGLLRDDAGSIKASQDPNFQLVPRGKTAQEMQLVDAQLGALKQKPIQDRNQIIKDAANHGFEATFDDGGSLVLTPTAKKLAEDSAQLEILKLKARKLKGGGGIAKGKQLPANMTAEFGTSKAALDGLNDINGIVSSHPEYFNQSKSIIGKGMNMLQTGAAVAGVGETGEIASQIDADLMARAQTVGRFLEGGKLAEGDIKRYTKMLPMRGDTDSTVASKVATLKRLIHQKINSELDTLQQGGFDTSRIPRQGMIEDGIVGKQPGGLIKAKPAAPQVVEAQVKNSHPQDSAAVTWARSNVKNADPIKAKQAKDIMKANGL